MRVKTFTLFWVKCVNTECNSIETFAISYVKCAGLIKATPRTLPYVILTLR